MKMLRAVFITVALGLGNSAAYGYGAANVDLVFSWGETGTEIGWSSPTPNTLAAMSNSTYFSTLTGNNQTGYYNSDFASAAQCSAIVAGLGGSAPITRKYGCRYLDSSSTPIFVATPVADSGPGASAYGVVSVTDTTMTGVLTVVSTTNGPSGGTATSVGTGSNGYNLRQADGSPFGNSWSGVSTAGTYTLNLTGTFTATSWQITGGSAKFSDANYLCQQGATSSPANILCSNSTAPGGYTPTGGSLSWGWELDGAATNLGNVAGGIDVRGADNALITTLSGLIADLSVSGDCNNSFSGTCVVSTNGGEIRRAIGRTAGCGLGPNVKNITYDASSQSITCGTLTTTSLRISTIPVPIPPAAWLFVSALGLVGVMRRKISS